MTQMNREGEHTDGQRPRKQFPANWAGGEIRTETLTGAGAVLGMGTMIMTRTNSSAWLWTRTLTMAMTRTKLAFGADTVASWRERR